jgi:hypothetical protein
MTVLMCKEGLSQKLLRIYLIGGCCGALPVPPVLYWNQGAVELELKLKLKLKRIDIRKLSDFIRNLNQPV